MEQSILSLVPPILALVMVILTRQVLISLGTGIVVGAFMLNVTGLPEGTSFFQAILTGFAGMVTMIYDIVKGLIISDGHLNSWNMYIIFFLLILGIMTSLITLSGGSRAFGEWAMKRVKTRVGAQIITFLLGIVVFIDDYFNSLAVGNVSRPITDRHHVSRAKLSYIIDSTSAPVCIISPISSWGAYIISIIGGILVTYEVSGFGALSAFMQMVPMNFYAIIALLFVFATAFFNINLGQMKVHENRAITKQQLVDPSKGIIPGETSHVPQSDRGRAMNLVLPIVVLVAATVYFMVSTGMNAVEEQVTILKIFENTDVAASLLYGGLMALAVTIVMTLMNRVEIPQFTKGVWTGIQAMLPAIYILFFAWTIIAIIDQLGTGTYLASLVDGRLNPAYLPLLLFLISGFMAFSTGTSWGTFGIMLGIGAEIAAAVDPTMLLPAMAAVLAGAVFGDHTSPISDTTILSSTGAGAHHIDHVLTQLPYAVITAIISAVGYVVLGFTGSTWLGLAAALLLLVIVVSVLKNKAVKSVSEAVN